MKIVYIAGPLTTGWDRKDHKFIEDKIRAAEEYAIALVNQGIGFFCSHAHTAFHNEKGSKMSESYYYELAREFMKRSADALLAMPGWETSKGAKMEVNLAKELNLPIFYPKSPDDLSEIIEWAK